MVAKPLDILEESQAGQTRTPFGINSFPNDADTLSTKSESRREKAHRLGARLRRASTIRQRESQESNAWSGHVTRDSVVEGMVQSLNNFENINEPQASLPQENYSNTQHPRRRGTSGGRGKTYQITAASQSSANLGFARDIDRGSSFPRLPQSRRSTVSQPQLPLATPAVESKAQKFLKNAKKLAKKKDTEHLYPSAKDSGISTSAADCEMDLREPKLSSEPRRGDHSRRRSRSDTAPNSVLERGRPVPPEYHNFTSRPGSPRRAGLRKSISYPTTSNGPPPTVTVAAPDMPRLDAASERSFMLGHRAKGSKDGGRSAGEMMVSSDGSSILRANDGAMSQAGVGSQRERPGFLKRVFGSSRSKTAFNMPTVQQPPRLPPLPVGEVDTAGRSMSIGAPAIPSKPPLPPEPEITQKPLPPQVLNKKTSFFRRRRKTLAEKLYPSSTNVQNVSAASDDPIQQDQSVSASVVQSPSSESLRQVMNAYLGSSAETQKNAGNKDGAQTPVESPDARSKQQDIYEFLQTASPNGGSSTPKAQMKADAEHVQALAAAERAQTSPSKSSAKTEAQPGSLHSGHPSAWKWSGGSLGKGGQPTSSTATSAQKSPTKPLTHLAQLDSTSLNTAPAVPTEDNHPSQDVDDFSKPNVNTSAPDSPAERAATTPPFSTAPAEPDDMDALLLASSAGRDSSSKPTSSRSNRLWLKSTDFDDKTRPSDAPSKDIAKPVQPEISVPSRLYGEEVETPLSQVEFVPVSPFSPGGASTDNVTHSTSNYSERAKCIFENQDGLASSAQGATALGIGDLDGDRLRSEYMALFDFSGLNILLALRDLCTRLALKAETQQVDRVLAAFSRRWCECNSNHGFKSSDVVHTICYSLLLLNTDLHVAEIEQKMTRTQFIKNTVPTILRVAEESSTDPDQTIRPNHIPVRGSIPWLDARSPSPLVSEERPSVETRGSESRISHRLPLRPTSDVPSFASPSPYDIGSSDASEMLVNAPFEGSVKEWASAIESVLREFYLSIRQLHLPLHGAIEPSLQEQASNASLSVVGNFMRRTGSIISKTPSDTSRGRQPDFRSTTSRWSSKNRSRPRLYPGSTFGSSRTASRTSLEESLWSPTASSTWSRSYGQTQTTMSTDSLASRHTPGDAGYHQSVGFANALSHAIIREENSVEEGEGADPTLLEDEELELAGAPWAKEGIVQHKYHLETTDKKAKDRNWNQCFAVATKGSMRLYSFNSKSSGRSQKSKSTARKGALIVGGGNWAENADAVGNYTLRQTIANVLPSPGYSKARPHVFALSLPNGAVHLFHVGTPEIAREFVSTVNYWSARLSKEPLVGGVSNVEYGWSANVVNTALITSSSAAVSIAGSRGRANSISNSISGPPSSYYQSARKSSIAAGTTSDTHQRPFHSPTPSAQSFSLSPSGRPSLQGSLRSRSSLDAGRPSSAFRTRLPADRIALAEWKPPQQSQLASNLREEQQLEAIRKYVNSVEEELAKHNELRSGLYLAFSPRSVNANKAMANWERKSSYLLREIVKFRTYLDVLDFGAQERIRIKNGQERIGVGPQAGGVPLGTVTAAKAMHSSRGSEALSLEDETGLPEETIEALKAARRKRTTTTNSESTA